jgi:hypothetical protein
MTNKPRRTKERARRSSRSPPSPSRPAALTTRAPRAADGFHLPFDAGKGCRAGLLCILPWKAHGHGLQMCVCLLHGPGRHGLSATLLVVCSFATGRPLESATAG